MNRTLSPTSLLKDDVGTASRSGTTLVEVLMALMIMSIGIVSVFSLFPVAIVASIRATQLTNGKIFKDNVEELLYTVPGLMRPPIGEPWQENVVWAGNWQPFKNYNVNDVIFPSTANGKLFPSPYYALRCTASSGTNRSGAIEPDWNDSTLVHDDGGVKWQAVRMPNFVVDPYGFYRSSVGERRVLGNRDSNSETDSYIYQLPRRTHGPDDNERLMTRLFSSLDSWSVVFEEIPTGIANDSPGPRIVFPTSTDVGGISNDADFPYTRVILTTPDRTQSIVRYPTAMSTGSTMYVTESIPAGFTGPARLETYSSRYSCFLAVSNIQESSVVGNTNADSMDVKSKESFPPPKVSVAVTFNRRLSSDVEHAYLANFGNQLFNLPGGGGTPIGSDQVEISWTTAEPDPYLKVGSYILDAKHLVFYRIVAISQSSGSATITLNQDVESTHKSRVNPSDGPGLAILMPGIIHVYNLEGVE